MVASSLRRGLAAGFVAGVLAGLFALVAGEPALEEAIRLEAAAAAGHQADAGVVVPRGVQRGGLVAGLALVGLSLGGLFGAVYAAVRPRLATASDAAAAAKVAAAGFLAVALVPALKYPANPPGVGDPATVGARTAAHLAVLGLSVVTVAASWAVARWLAGHGARIGGWLAAGAVAAAGAVVLAVAFPPPADSGGVPAALLGGFRLAALATQAVLWLGLAAVFAVLSRRRAQVRG